MSKIRTNFSKSRILALHNSLLRLAFWTTFKKMQSFLLHASESPRNKGYSRCFTWSSFSSSKSRLFCLFLDPEQQKCSATSVPGAKALRTLQTKKNACQNHRPSDPRLSPRSVQGKRLMVNSCHKAISSYYSKDN